MVKRWFHGWWVILRGSFGFLLFWGFFFGLISEDIVHIIIGWLTLLLGPFFYSVADDEKRQLSLQEYEELIITHHATRPDLVGTKLKKKGKKDDG